VDDVAITQVPKGNLVGHYSAPQIDSAWDLKWSPFGNFLSFFSISNSSKQLIIMDSNGRQVNQASVDNLAIFSWSPKEDQILYLDGMTEFRDIRAPFPHIINVQRGDINEICLPGDAIWSPDGNHIAVFVGTEAGENVIATVKDIFIFDILSNKLYELDIANPETIGSVLGWVRLEQR
jgi:hypothetical protein